MHKKTIDPITGRMFMKHTLQDDLRDKRQREKAMLDRKADFVATQAEDFGESQKEIARKQLVREMDMDQTFAEFPSPQRREWSIAQGHLLRQTALTDKELVELSEQQEQVDSHIEKEAYESVMTRLSARQSKTESQMGSKLFENLLLEKSLDLDQFSVLPDLEQGDIQKTLRQTSDEVVLEGKQFKGTKLSIDDLEGVSEDVIQSKIDELMGLTLDASRTDKQSQS